MAATQDPISAVVAAEPEGNQWEKFLDEFEDPECSDV